MACYNGSKKVGGKVGNIPYTIISSYISVFKDCYAKGRVNIN